MRLLVQIGDNKKGFPIKICPLEALTIIKEVHLHLSLSSTRIRAEVSLNMVQDLEISHFTIMEILEFLVLHHQDNNFIPIPQCHLARSMVNLVILQTLVDSEMLMLQFIMVVRFVGKRTTTLNSVISEMPTSKITLLQ